VWFVGTPLQVTGDDDGVVPSDVDLRVVRPADRHLTLVYLGPVPEPTAHAIWASIPPLPVPTEVRAVRWERLGKSAVALELTDDDGRLAAAAGVCHEAAAKVIDIEPPRVFRPHLTMARVPRRVRPPTNGVLGEWPVPSGPIAVGRPTLFRSNPQSAGDRYEVVDQQSAPR
jgi:2'-5' RNA ligase